MLSTLKKHTKTIILFVISRINYLIPKNKRIILLRSDYMYPDNIHAVLEKLLEIKGNYIIICEGNGFERYRSSKIKIVKMKSLKSLLYYFRSYYQFYDIDLYSSFPCCPKQISVNTWHGTAFKKIGNYLSERKVMNSCSYTIGYSPLFAEVTSKAFGVPIKNVIITGDPRIDFFSKPVSDYQLEELGINKDSIIVIWMPTYRTKKGSGEKDGHAYDFGLPFLNKDNLLTFNEYCKERNVTMVLKLHAREIASLPSQGYSNIIYLTNDMISQKQMAFYSIIARTSALITDYSSIFVNYLVLDKPICFAYDDLDEYIGERGIMFDDPESLMPGYIAKDFESLLLFIDDLSKGIDKGKDLRKKLSNKLNTFSDNKNSERILRAVHLLKQDNDTASYMQ